MTRAFIGIGSNIDPAANVRSAVLILAEEVRLLGVSSIYQTKPEHHLDQAPFYNGVVAIETARSAGDLKFQLLRGIEARLGRQRLEDKNAARTIDLDLLLYGDLLSNTPGLELPDPGIFHRPVVTIPLCELAPHLVPPGTTNSVSKLAAALSKTGMVPLESYTARLRREAGLDSRPLGIEALQFARAIARWENEGGAGDWRTWCLPPGSEFFQIRRAVRPPRAGSALKTS